MDRCRVYPEDDIQIYSRAVTWENAGFYPQKSSEDRSWPVLALCCGLGLEILSQMQVVQI